MGFHLCEYDHQGIEVKRNISSSGGVVMFFSDGTIFEMPDMIVHYVGDIDETRGGDGTRKVEVA